MRGELLRPPRLLPRLPLLLGVVVALVQVDRRKLKLLLDRPPRIGRLSADEAKILEGSASPGKSAVWFNNRLAKWFSDPTHAWERRWAAPEQRAGAIPVSARRIAGGTPALRLDPAQLHPRPRRATRSRLSLICLTGRRWYVKSVIDLYFRFTI